MAEEIIITTRIQPKVLYKNGKVVRVHERGLYDVQFLNGRIETYVENISGLVFISGDFVSLLFSGTDNLGVCKILGRGKKVTDIDEIKTVRV